MKKLILIIFSFLALIFITGCANQKIKYHKPLVRDVTLINEQIDYQSFFNDFTKQEVILDKNKNTIEFKATREMDASLFEEIDFVNYSSNKNKVEFDYDVNYDANTNEFTLSIKANTEKGMIIDNWQGTPFINEKGQTDIAFATDDGVVYLSELEDSGVINKCGWFSRLFRKIAKIAAIVAAVAVVVAVAVVAAPVAAAAGTAFATATASGGVAALASGSAATAMAVAASTAVASTAFAVASTTAIVAGFSAISAYLASKSFASMEEKVDAAVTELSKTKDGNKGVMLFRGAKKGAPYKSFMPRENGNDYRGISFFSDFFGLVSVLKGVSDNGVYITTTHAINSTGVFYYLNDRLNHYNVFLKNGTTAGWTEKHANLLASISFFVPGLIK